METGDCQQAQSHILSAWQPQEVSISTVGCLLLEGSLGVRQAKLKGSLQRSGSNGSSSSFPIPDRGQAPLP